MAEVLRQSNVHENCSKDQLRKTKKPLMEKKRRARINSCLNDIKSLLLQAFNKDGSQFSKLEKADILEMTVKYLRSVQQSQLSAAVRNDHDVTTRYKAGYAECAKETMRYVDNVQVSETLRSRLSSHLTSCVQAINTGPPTTTVMQPVYIQIPSFAALNTQVQPTHYVLSPQIQRSSPSTSESDLSPLTTTSQPGSLLIPKAEYPVLNHFPHQPTHPNLRCRADYTTENISPYYKVCQDVVCVERSSSESKSLNCQHLPSITSVDTVWRPW